MDGWNEGWSEPAFPSAEPRHTILHSEPSPHLAGQLEKQELFGKWGQRCWTKMGDPENSKVLVSVPVYSLAKVTRENSLVWSFFLSFSPSCTHHICCISVTGNRHRIVNACSKPKLKCNPLHLVNSPFLLESK